jgi:uncharacterized protein YukE
VEPTADPAALEAAARALKQVAAALQNGGLTGSFHREASASSWTGHAADEFRNSVKDDWSRGKSLGDDLKAIAAMIEAGANKCRQIRAAQAAAQAKAQRDAAQRLGAYPH